MNVIQMNSILYLNIMFLVNVLISYILTQELSDDCKLSLSSHIHSHNNIEVPFRNGRAEISNNEVTSDHHMISIATMPVILLLLAIVSTAFYIICGKFRSIYKNKNQVLPANQLEEGEEIRSPTIRHRIVKI